MCIRDRRTADHRILAIAEYVCSANKDKSVVLITKDINLRMKAKSLGIIAQDYENDKVANIDDLYKGIRILEGVNQESISKLYEVPEGVGSQEFNLEPNLKGHQFFIMKNNGSSALAAALQQHKRYKQIFLARPIVPLANRDLGFLPGDVKEKMDPYMQPLYDNLTVIKHKFSHQSPEFLRINDMMKEDKLVITPLAYIRGRSLSSIFFIVDEAQNLTPHEIKTIITRAGEGTKMVFTGDIEQIDSPYLDIASNGLSYLSDKMKDQDIFAHVNLVKGERSFLAELASKLL